MERIKEEDVVRQFNVSLPGEEEEPEAMFPYLLRQLTEVINYCARGEAEPWVIVLSEDQWRRGSQMFIL